MAKKKNETNAVPMEQELIAVNNPLAETSVFKGLGTPSITFEEKSYERALSSLSIPELIYIEQCTRVV